MNYKTYETKHREIIRNLEDMAENDEVWDQDERCLISEFFAEEARKPIRERKNYCMISCPCGRCNPARL